jgi:hypothetical protein
MDPDLFEFRSIPLDYKIGISFHDPGGKFLDRVQTSEQREGGLPPRMY